MSSSMSHMLLDRFENLPLGLLAGRVEHGNDVLRRYVGQEVGDLLEDESIARN